MRPVPFLLAALLLCPIPQAQAQAAPPPFSPTQTQAPTQTQTPTQTQAAAPALPSGLGAVTHTTLPNGLQVLAAPSSAADLVTVDVWVGAGTRRETDADRGAAHFIEHLIFKGTPTRSPGQIDAAIEDLGGSLNAATSYDWAHFYVTVGASDALAALTVVADAVMHASLRQADMDTERSVILSERARQLASPATRTTEAATALLFPDHPYGRPLLGTPQGIVGMTRAQVQDFYKANYVPGNVTLVLSGNISAQAAQDMAQKAFGAWPAAPVPAGSLPAAPALTQMRAATLSGGPGRAYLTLGWQAPAVSDQPDAWVMDVLLTYLGQAGNNKLDQDLKRRQKIVSAISASYLTQRDRGQMTITASFDPTQTEPVRRAILADITALREVPLNADEIGAARRALLASYLFDAETNSGRANALGFYNTINTYRYDTDYLAHVLSVTPAQVQAVARKYLDPAVYASVTLLPPTNPVLASRRR